MLRQSVQREALAVERLVRTMPFTLAHAAAAWPLWHASGRRLRLAALMIGCAVPDFEYFLRLQPDGHFGHTLLGLFVWCLPVGWLTLWLFDRFGRRGVQALLPADWALPPPTPGIHSAANISAALLLGAASHLVWDAFTHRTGLGVALLPALATPLSLGPLNVPWYKVLQHGSTIAGLLVLIALAAAWSARQPRAPRGRLVMRTIAIASVPLAAGLLNGLRFWPVGLQPFVVGTGVAFAFVVVLTPVLLGALLCLFHRTTE